MKKLNRYYKNSALNKKIRYWYDFKQVINNSKMSTMHKRLNLAYCDDRINECWRRFYTNQKGYTVQLEMINARRDPDNMPISNNRSIHL